MAVSWLRSEPPGQNKSSIVKVCLNAVPEVLVEAELEDEVLLTEDDELLLADELLLLADELLLLELPVTLCLEPVETTEEVLDTLLVDDVVCGVVVVVALEDAR
jgi:hypothetical protein